MDNKTGASGVFVKTFTLGVWRQTFTFLSEFKRVPRKLFEKPIENKDNGLKGMGNENY